jgi:hypothetical protein
VAGEAEALRRELAEMFGELPVGAAVIKACVGAIELFRAGGKRADIEALGPLLEKYRRIEEER